MTCMPGQESVSVSLTKLRLTIEINQGQPLEILARLQGFGKALDKVRTIE